MLEAIAALGLLGAAMLVMPFGRRYVRHSAPARMMLRRRGEPAAALAVLAQPVAAPDSGERDVPEVRNDIDPVAASNLGVLLELRGNVDGAAAAYRRADARGDATGAFNLGGLLAQKGDFAEAIAAYRRADARGAAGAAFRLGGLLAEQGDLAGAEEAYRRAQQGGVGEAEMARSALGGLRSDRR